MILREMLEVVYNAIDETDEDEQVAIICKNAINEAYSLLCMEDVRLTTSYVPVINGVAEIPNDCAKIVKITPELDRNDVKVGNNIVTNKKATYTILYNYIREPLIYDEDEPDLHLTLHMALVNYACYKYFLHRKRTDVGQMYLEKFNQDIYKFNQDIKEDTGGSVEYIRRYN